MTRSDAFARPSRLCTVTLLLACGLVLPGTVEAQQDWPIRCNLRTTSIRFFDRGFSLDFSGASAGTRVRQPATGECAWEDRGWGADEPERLSFATDVPLLIGVDIDSENRFRNVVVVNAAPQVAREAVNLVAEAWVAGTAITFYVHRVGNTMRVGRIVR
jgi:hypothetical protein